jgi:acyl-CoA thioesterase FadM
MLYNQFDILLTTASTVLVFVNEANNKPMRIPSELSAIFAQYEIKE